jgi:hypothetical protein
MGAVGKGRMSLQVLLEPTNDEPPCGPNLEYDPEFVAVDQALRPRPEHLVGEPAAGSAAPDWTDIRRRCEALLGRTRDLRLAMMYLRALTHTDQLAGFAEGLGLVSGLLDRYWCAPCKGGAFQWVQVPPGKRSSRKQPERAWRRRNVRSLRVKRATNWWLRECAGRNVSKRRASLEKVDAQADPAAIPGKAEITGWMSDAVPPVAVPG